MKKTLQVIGIIFGVIVVLLGLLVYKGINKTSQIQDLHAKSDSIIENLDQESVFSHFPKKYFPEDQIYVLLGTMTLNCDWKNRDGKFVDYFTMGNIGGVDQVSFIYEYYLDCDSLRFILTYNLDDEPELMGFHIEELEKENPMVIFPEKQLKNRK